MDTALFLACLALASAGVALVMDLDRLDRARRKEQWIDPFAESESRAAK